MSSMLYPAQWILFLALYRASYEAANAGQDTPLAERSRPPALPDQSSTDMAPGEREWALKAAERYALAQEKKWRRWRDAMFEADANPTPR